MTETLRTARDQPDEPITPAASATDTIELLGLVGQLELVAFAQLAADAAAAPTTAQRIELTRFAAASVTRRDTVLARIAELGGDPVAAVAAFDHVLDDFDERTAPSTWWERLLRAYVGYGVADDFCRLAAAGIDERSREVVLAVLDDASRAELAVAELDAAGDGDGALSARLALWGRRLVGEALGVVQRLVVQRPGLVRLLTTGAARESEVRASVADASGTTHPAAASRPNLVSSEGNAQLFGELTAQHTRRMSRLGLTA